MRNDENPYEDELDRMRARNQRRNSSNDSLSFLPNTSSKNQRQEYQRNNGSTSHAQSSRGGNRRTSTRSADPRSRSGQDSRRQRKRRKSAGSMRFFVFFCLAIVLFASIWSFRRIRTQEDGYWTVAVFGVDSRDGNTGKGALSDVEMLCSIHRKTGEIRLLSVFRDTYVRIDQKEKFHKINEAYFLGGPEQAVKTLEDNFDLQIDDYATFNWKAVVDAINVLGGVDIDITDKEFAYINSFITETVNSTGVGSHHLEHSGMNHLDGVQAVAYARLRLMDTDFNRTERQRKILGQTMEKAKSADLKTLTTLIGTVYPQTKTSIGVDNLASMAKNAKKYYISQTSGFPFSHQEIKINKRSCVVPTTLESNVIQLHSYLYDSENYMPSDNVKAISSHIIKVSGLGEPGKDIESGKNVGAAGNNGSGQAVSTQPQTQETVVETETEESIPETEESERETEETISPLESESEIFEDDDDDEASQESDSSISETRDPDRVIEAPLGNTDNNMVNSENQGPGVEKPGKPGNNNNNNNNETNAILEAPGQGAQNKPEEQGPGV